jgi:hypothetical protein
MSSTRLNREYFFFLEEELGEFSYDTYKFGGLRFFLKLAPIVRKSSPQFVW